MGLELRATEKNHKVQRDKLMHVQFSVFWIIFVIIFDNIYQDI